MLNRITLLRHSERGQVIVLLVVVLVVLLGAAALVVDVGRAYLIKRHLQASADAAATGGAERFEGAMIERMHVEAAKRLLERR